MGAAGLWQRWDEQRLRVQDVQRRMRAAAEIRPELNAEMERHLDRMYAIEDDLLRRALEPEDACRLLRMALHWQRAELGDGEELGANWRLVERAVQALSP